MQHRYNRDSPHCLYLVPSNLPEVNQSITDTSTSLGHDYQTNYPYSIHATSSPHNQSNCETYVHLPQLKNKQKNTKNNNTKNKNKKQKNRINN